MKMQRWLELMQLILTDMREESKNCGVLEFVTSPVQVMPLEPSLFFGHGGWAVSFVRKQTVIWKRKLMRWKRLFLLLPEWADRYNYFVELGESLPAMPVTFQVPENRIACSLSVERSQSETVSGSLGTGWWKNLSIKQRFFLFTAKSYIIPKLRREC